MLVALKEAKIWLHALLKIFSGFSSEALSVGRIALQTHGRSIIEREFLSLELLIDGSRIRPCPCRPSSLHGNQQRQAEIPYLLTPNVRALTKALEQPSRHTERGLGRVSEKRRADDGQFLWWSFGPIRGSVSWHSTFEMEAHCFVSN
jgi:hypothetical protein